MAKKTLEEIIARANTPAILTPDRAMYDWIKKQPEFSGKTVTSSYLKLMVALGSTGAFNFNVLDDGGTTAPVAGEQRLPRSDAFWAMQYGFFIGKVASAGNVRSIQEQTFANPYVFTGATELPALQALYNGTLKIEIASRVYYDKTDLKRFENAGVAQQGLEVSTATNNSYSRSEFNPRTGLYEMTPHLLFSGQSTPRITVELPESVDMSGESGSTNYAIFYARGFYIPDGANLGR